MLLLVLIPIEIALAAEGDLLGIPLWLWILLAAVIFTQALARIRRRRR